MKYFTRSPKPDLSSNAESERYVTGEYFLNRFRCEYSKETSDVKYIEFKKIVHFNIANINILINGLIRSDEGALDSLAESKDMKESCLIIYKFEFHSGSTFYAVFYDDDRDSTSIFLMFVVQLFKDGRPNLLEWVKLYA
jgi:hypothetical protein